MSILKRVDKKTAYSYTRIKEYTLKAVKDMNYMQQQANTLKYVNKS